MISAHHVPPWKMQWLVNKALENDEFTYPGTEKMLKEFFGPAAWDSLGLEQKNARVGQDAENFS